ncbi:MAG: hypothetical protein ACE5FJ_03305 [Gemmatimonadales bacterium]
MRGAFLFVCSAVLATATGAQERDVCRVNIDSVGGSGQRIETPRGLRFHGNRGVWVSCIDDLTRMFSDSIAGYQRFQRLDLIRRVHFDDGVVTLEADRASYFLNDQRLEASGNVRLTNRRSGSVLVGPNLTYYRVAEGIRDSALMLATGRPTVHYQSLERGDAADTTDAYVIVGDRLRMVDDENAWAFGTVTIDRSDFSARSDSAFLDTRVGQGELMGHATVGGRADSSYTMNGATIAFRTVNDKLEWVQARDDATAVSAAWDLAADTIEFAISNELVQGGIAWGRISRATARTAEYEMTADSLEIDLPGQQLQEIRGFGAAVAVTLADGVAEPDWIGGDSLTARFGDRDGRRVLNMLEALGNARAFYRVYPNQPGALPGINYSRGDRIIASFGAAGIERVDVIGAADGVYLEPAAGPGTDGRND